MNLTESIKTQSLAQVISHAIAYSQKEGIAIAVWKDPGEENIQLILDFSTPPEPVAEPLEQRTPGFVFAPYDMNKDTYFIKAELQLCLGNYQVKRQPSYPTSIKVDAFLQHLATAGSPTTEQPTSIHAVTAQADEDNFKALVIESVKAIRDGVFQKVVPSRKKEITFDHPFQIGDNFVRLTEVYPSAFVSLAFIPQTGVWMGASPELLIGVKDNIFKTVALAGTQKYEEGTSLSNVAWTQKEIEEQAFVSRYIINCFKKIRLREFDEAGPKTVIAGNLLHLKTELKVDIEATKFPDLGEVMLQLLHPTSAICGMPMEPARQFLEEKEHYDRSYFSGYLGPAHFNGTTTLYVNLRCMHIEEKKATLFAGAGVTEDSIPDKEWLETEIKMKTLLNIIH